MSSKLTEIRSEEAALALAYTPPILRDALTIFFDFDSRLARIVSATNEPMLGQMRLAWWRDTLGTEPKDRPQGDAVLDAIGARWGEATPALVALVDGWETMLSEPPLPREAAAAFADGRAQALAGLARLGQASEPVTQAIKSAGRIWAIADAVSHLSPGEERETMLALGKTLPTTARLPSPFRGVAVLGALGSRAIASGGAPLMAGRGAALTALRAGLLGR